MSYCRLCHSPEGASGGMSAVSSACAARAQPPDEDSDGVGFWWYMCIVHLLAFLGIMDVIRRIAGWTGTSTSASTSEKSCQTEEPHRGERSVAHGGGSSSEPNQTQVRERSNTPVWVIGNGQRYHSEACGMVRANLSRARTVSRIQAIRAGLTACQQCGG